MKVTGTLINYYFHCKKQCWLLGNRINLEDNSEDVHIGKVLHEIRDKKDNKTEIKIENIRVDKITKEYIVEFKKSDSDIEATKWQTLLYLKKLKDKGIERKGKLEFYEKKKQSKKMIYIELTEEKEKELEKLEIDISNLIADSKSPKPLEVPKCKKCAYYTYCYI